MNFIKSRSSNMLVPYDYSSVMHYGRLAFSRRGMPTITPLWAPSVQIGQRWNLSTSDIARLQTHSDGRSPTPASRPYLQQLLKALLAESRSPDPSGFGAEESPRVWKPPALRNSGVEASARPPQPPASSLRSRPGAVVPGIALEQSWQAQVPAVPPDSSLEAEDQPAIV
eukprot:bmy_06904T0